jgi:hypothetical protein
MSNREIKVITECFKVQTNFCKNKNEMFFETEEEFRPDGQNILNRCSIQLGLVIN